MLSENQRGLEPQWFFSGFANIYLDKYRHLAIRNNKVENYYSTQNINQVITYAYML